MRGRLSDVSIPKKLSLIVLIFLLINIALLIVANFGMKILSDVRAYVGGEGLWSKAQKDAMYYLVRYAVFHEEADYIKYQDFLNVPLGDRKARVQLEREDTNYDASDQGFIEGRNHPDDVRGMALLFKRYTFVPYIRDAVAAWQDGDKYLSELMDVGDEIRQEVLAGTMTPQRSRIFLRRIEEVNAKLTPVEDKFSFTLGEGARQLIKWLLWSMLALTGVLLLVGLFLSYRIGRRLVEEIHNLRAAASRIAKGDYSQPIAIESTDEIGDLARSFQEMAVQREKAEATLAQRAQDLADANRKLIETERLKDDFFATVSHELRTPLTLVLSPLETLLAGDLGTLEPSQRQTLEVMHNNTVRLLQMVSGLLDFSKLEAGRMQVSLEPMHLVTLTQSLINDFQPILQQKDLRIRFDYQPTEITVLMDRYFYERIVFNLLSNAVKFTPAGGAITVSLAWNEGRLWLAVKDTGIGIAPQNIPHLFQKFRQLEGAATRRFEGTGLGLALVKEFATLLDGTVSVTSEEGQGSTFVVECNAESPGQELRGSVADGRSSSRAVQKFPADEKAAAPVFEVSSLYKVLIAEDNAELAAYIATLLRHSCQTKIARDGEEALGIAKEWKPDLVISDVMMPKMDGLALCREINRLEETSRIPVLLLTALTHREALLRGWEAGADEYLFKPFHPKELITRVQSMLAAAFERKRAEVRLIQINQDLEKEVEKRTARLQQANEELRHFSQIASHDLREPVRKIGVYMDLLKTQFGESLEAKAVDYIDRVRMSAKRVDQLIQSMVEYSTLDKRAEDFEPVPMNTVVKEALEDLEIALDRAQAKVHVEDLPVVKGDRVQLRQMVQNLIANSVKFHNPNQPPEIWISGRIYSNGFGEINFEDNGIGFDEQYAERIFQPFERLHDKQSYEGFGLGLSICKKIVQRHEGTIAAHSRAGQGTVFTITLPIFLKN